ncbi:MAG: hypothetical protein IKR84_05955 [Oscillibacter sp.]|nr:hypothetical protein [Oscillibacter sp.]
MKLFRRAGVLLLALLSALSGIPAARAAEPAEEFRNILIRNIDQFVDGGGYYTKKEYSPLFVRTAWDGMEQALSLQNGYPVWDLSVLRPSFCSEACYMALLKALSDWDTNRVISPAAWRNLKPYTVEGTAWPVQTDGEGCWGRANATAPGSPYSRRGWAPGRICISGAGTSTPRPPPTGSAGRAYRRAIS